ncbi:hypothetical protein GGF32_000542 [Allomyces javanicus]|nr:hypothetical protein GGF32_000542 [Allomyces javanicus]
MTVSEKPIEKGADAKLESNRKESSFVIDSDFENVVSQLAPRVDDTTTPSLTFRVWVLGTLFCVLLGVMNQLFSFRTNSFGVSSYVAVLLAYPLGVLMARTIPAVEVNLGPLGSFNLNPGPFSVKEHVLIGIFGSTGASGIYGTDNLVVQKLWYELEIGPVWSILFLFASSTLGFGISGISRKFLIRPAHMIWPSVLPSVALYSTFHSSKNEDLDSNGVEHMSRMKVFGIGAIGMAAFHLIGPGFVSPLLQYLPILCWIAPASATIAQQVGSPVYGTGVLSLTLDWTTIGSGSMSIPFWSAANQFVSYLFFMWLITPLNVKGNWFNQPEPSISINSSKLMNNVGMAIGAAKLVDKSTNTIRDDVYEANRPIYLSPFFAWSYFGSMATFMAAVSHTIVWYGKDIWARFRASQHDQEEDIHCQLIDKYPESLTTDMLGLTAAPGKARALDNPYPAQKLGQLHTHIKAFCEVFLLGYMIADLIETTWTDMYCSRDSDSPHPPAQLATMILSTVTSAELMFRHSAHLQQLPLVEFAKLISHKYYKDEIPAVLIASALATDPAFVANVAAVNNCIWKNKGSKTGAVLLDHLRKYVKVDAKSITKGVDLAAHLTWLAQYKHGGTDTLLSDMFDVKSGAYCINRTKSDRGNQQSGTKIGVSASSVKTRMVHQTHGGVSKVVGDQIALGVAGLWDLMDGDGVLAGETSIKVQLHQHSPEAHVYRAIWYVRCPSVMGPGFLLSAEAMTKSRGKGKKVEWAGTANVVTSFHARRVPVRDVVDKFVDRAVHDMARVVRDPVHGPIVLDLCWRIALLHPDVPERAECFSKLEKYVAEISADEWKQVTKIRQSMHVAMRKELDAGVPEFVVFKCPVNTCGKVWPVAGALVYRATPNEGVRYHFVCSCDKLDDGTQLTKRTPPFGVPHSSGLFVSTVTLARIARGLVRGSPQRLVAASERFRDTAWFPDSKEHLEVTRELERYRADGTFNRSIKKIVAMNKLDGEEVDLSRSKRVRK